MTARRVQPDAPRVKNLNAAPHQVRRGAAGAWSVPARACRNRLRAVGVVKRTKWGGCRCWQLAPGLTSGPAARHAIVGEEAKSQKAARGGLLSRWWRRRELNPRPRMIQIQFYMRSRSIFVSPRAWPIGRPARSQSLDLDAAVMTPPASSFREWRCCRLPDLARKRTSAASGRY